MDDGMHHDLCAGHLLLGHRFLLEDVQSAAGFLANCSGIQFADFHKRTKTVRRRGRDGRRRKRYTNCKQVPVFRSGIRRRVVPVFRFVADQAEELCW